MDGWSISETNESGLNAEISDKNSTTTKKSGPRPPAPLCPLCALTRGGRAGARSARARPPAWLPAFFGPNSPRRAQEDRRR
eukprot:7000352-Prymnesium_polylepis.1